MTCFLFTQQWVDFTHLLITEEQHLVLSRLSELNNSLSVFQLFLAPLFASRALCVNRNGTLIPLLFNSYRNNISLCFISAAVSTAVLMQLVLHKPYIEVWKSG